MVNPTGGVPGSPSIGSSVPSGSSGNVTPIPLDDIQPSQSISTLKSPGIGAPILAEGELGYLEFARLISEVIQALKEALVSSQQGDFLLNQDLYNQNIASANFVLDLQAEVLAEVESQIKEVENIIKDVADAYAELETAYNEYNAAFGSITANTNAVNAALATYNDLQTGNYAAKIAALGGETAARNLINGAINTWNNYASSRNANADTLINNLNSAKQNWEAAIVAANVKIDQLNVKRTKRGLSLISKYPVPTPTIGITLPDPRFIPGVASVSSPLGPGKPKRDLLAPPKTVGVATGLPSSAVVQLGNIPTINEAIDLLTPILGSLLAILDAFATILALVSEEIEEEIIDQLVFNGGRNIVFPDAYIQRVPKEFISTVGGGSGIGQIGFLPQGVEDLLGNELLKTVLQNEDVPLTPRFVSSLQLAALGLLSQSSLLSSSAAAQLFGNKLGFIAADSPGFAATIAVAMADTFISAVSSNSTRLLVNQSLKNEVFQARLSGEPAGKLTNLSAGETAALEKKLTAGLNISILATALKVLERNLGFPNLALQVLANTSGLSTLDALTAKLGGSQIQNVLNSPLSLLFIKQTLAETLALRRGEVSPAQINAIIDGAITSLGGKFANINILQGALRREAIFQGLSPDNASLLSFETQMLIRGEIGIPGLNEAIRTDLDGEAAAREVLDAIFKVNEAVSGSAEKDAIVKRIGEDRIAIETIIKEEIQRATRLGAFEINRELRNELVKSLRSGGARLDEAQYLSNQVINLLAGNKVAPVTGMNGSNIESIRAGAITSLSGDFGSKSAALVNDAIQKALAKGPISSEGEFLALVRSELSLSGGEVAFDAAIAGASPLQTLGIEELHKNLGAHLTGLLTPDLGEQKAAQIKDEILSAILGNPSIKEIADDEKRRPNSLVNQIGKQIEELTDQDEIENLKKSLRKLIQLLQAMMTPNAELGFIIQSMQDKPSTVISSLAAGQGAVKSGDILGTGPA